MNDGKVKINNNIIYSLEEIKSKTELILKKYNIEKAFLFGSYARGEATKESDIDIMTVGASINSSLIGCLFEDLKLALKKEIDLVREESYFKKQTVYFSIDKEINKDREEFYLNLFKERVLIYEKQEK